MYPKFRLHCLGYDMPEDYDTIGQAHAAMRDLVKDDIEGYHGKLAKVIHSKDSIELKIGNKDSTNTYSYYVVQVIR